MNCNIKAFLPIVGILLSVFAQSQTLAKPLGKLCIIGGGDRPETMIQRIATEAGLDKGGYAVILPMSSEEPDSSVYYTQIQFEALGYRNIRGLFATKADVDSPQKIDSILQAKLVYITGGDQSRFMEVVRGTKMEQAIRTMYALGGMVAGTSAGAAVQSEVMITGNSLKVSEYSSTLKSIESANIETTTGLGLITTAVIDQHFLIRSRHNRLLSVILERPHLLGIGIDEATAILVKDGTAEVIGLSQVMVYRHKGKKTQAKDGKYGARDIRLDIYLPGERFRVKK